MRNDWDLGEYALTRVPPRLCQDRWYEAEDFTLLCHKPTPRGGSCWQWHNTDASQEGKACNSRLPAAGKDSQGPARPWQAAGGPTPPRCSCWGSAASSVPAAHARPWTQLKATTHMDTLRGHWSPRYHKERRPPILCSISQAVMRHSSLPVLPTSTACANALTESCRFTPGMDAYPHSLRQDATKLLIAVLLHSQGSADGRQALLLNQLHQGCLRRQPGAIQPMPSSLLVGTSNY